MNVKQAPRSYRKITEAAQQALQQPWTTLGDSCGKPCSNLTASLEESLEASLAAFLQQSCSNHLEAMARADGRAILQQTLNQAFLQHSYNNFAASSTIKQKHKNKSQNTPKIGPDPAKIGAKSTPGTLLGAHRKKVLSFAPHFLPSGPKESPEASPKSLRITKNRKRGSQRDT